MTDIAQLGISVDSREVKSADKDLDNLAKAADGAENAVKGVGDAAAKAKPKVSGFNGGVQKGGKGLNNFKNIAGQAGFQVQDFAVQLEGGTGFLRAFGQQGSQLAGAFGPTGAIVGAVIAVGAAIGSVLAPAIFESKTAVDRLDKSLAELSGTIEITDDGTIRLTDSFKRLAAEAQNLAAVQIQSKLLSATNAQTAAFDSLKEGSDGLGKSFKASGIAARGVANRIGRASKELGITKDQFLLINDAAKTAFSTKSVEDITKYRDAVSKVALEAKGATDEFKKQAEKINNASLKYIEQTNVLQFLGGTKLENVVATKAQEEADIKAEKALKIFNKTLNENSRIISKGERAKYLADKKAEFELLKKENQEKSKNLKIQRDFDSARNAVISQELRLTEASKERAEALSAGAVAAGIGEEQLKSLLQSNDDLLASQIEGIKQVGEETENAFAVRAKQNIQDSIADAIINGVNDGGKGALESFGDLMLKMAAEAVAADIMNGIFNGGGMAGGIGGGDNTAGLIGGLGSLFAGFFDQGGNIPSGQFGIAGENGPEIIQGPANVTSTKDTAAAMNNGTSIGNINMSFPGIGNANEARIAAGQAAREINGIVGSSKRFA
jgi:hypothetical protein